jgi:hypothetical protein
MLKPCRTCGATERGQNGRCLPCGRRRYRDGSWPSSTSEYRSAWYRAHPEMRADQRRRVYGLAPGAYDALLTEQDGKCAICQKFTKLGVDHDHDSGAVRGLLCGNCNIGIGNLRDDIGVITGALNYLEKFQKLSARKALKVV